MPNNELLRKYNVPGPRYTSYPTVPYWDESTFDSNLWETNFQRSLRSSDAEEGISIYIHLPYCESLCTFCGCHKHITKQHTVETPYIDALIREWELYTELFDKRPLIREIHLGGGTPTFFAPEQISRLINGILALADRHPQYEFSFEGHPNNTTRDHLQALYDVGFRRVSFGVQDYSPIVQKAINRVQTFETVKNATLTAREIGYTSVNHDLVYGLPFQTKGDIIDTMNLTIPLMPERIAFYSYAHVPWIKGNGQRGFDENDIPSGPEKRILYETGKILLEELNYKEIGMDHFALPEDALYGAMKNGVLHRNFMGYTPSKTGILIGLGASSISDCWNGFAQNVKGINEYKELVSRSKIPVYRGHMLLEEDLKIRRHILNLMCAMKTSWKTKAEQFPELPSVLSKLKEMQQDGLIEISENELTITDIGKAFVRNICMAFDLRLQRNKPDTQLFSMTV
ncbi:oxygen-independent coproporphyrinogen III oxidase [Robertkochia solimangrovi]|uniref:oxygen-independent coproporphyrinogen III oxidase n=1 Tax=Robertkochia solimangrovi TaxID=2213046 RepID=UPI00117C7F6C|nr:oxygen-independent coproporphyrinogen III oxidase [Robertkochia solimangrovi]TRZ46195.1 oxygen-independent coproporphyrinogen III oxidase [Robertkochia solimangrovi]